ncbi:MAG: T9SS type A sorting domain-containing protein [Fluviicola sp.]|nr:T9SS type A sorting domain-containing protein [Fluviicola sp.]
MMSLKQLLFAFIFFQTVNAFSQPIIDTLAFQDFEITPSAPAWSFTGPVVYNSGISSMNAAPTNSPIGINGSQAWETTSNSGGLILDFNNTLIPTGYDSIRINFKLAAMNLNGSTGGPDDLDYVLVSYSLDNGVSFVNRLRIRGAVANNSFWGYDATGDAAVYYLPASESLFQPALSGLATTDGYSNCEVVFPGSITQLQLRIIGRSSSSSDTWLIDNLLLTGESLCTPTFSNFSLTACNSFFWSQTGQTYTASGAYNDTILNAAGCDSIITLNLTINSSTYSSQTITACDGYIWSQTGQTYTTSGNYNDTIPNVAGCDSIITLMLTINSSTYSSQSITACDSYTWPQTGQTYTISGNYNDTIPNVASCDSIITLMLTINSSTYSSQSITVCDSYTWPQTAQTYTISGNYIDTILNVSGCDSIITLILTINQTPNSSATADATNVLTATGGSTFQWINCTTNQPINGASSATFTPTVNGTYAAIVGNGNACDDTTNCITISTIGLSEISNISIELHPNPTNDLVRITFESNEARVVIYDTQGKLIQTKSIHSGEQVSLKEVETGVYFFEVTTEKGSAVKRVVKD